MTVLFEPTAAFSELPLVDQDCVSPELFEFKEITLLLASTLNNWPALEF